jgi:hypothetical protein
MPLLSGGGKIFWIITGLFLLFATLIVTYTEVALPAAMIFPALYCLYSERVPSRWPFFIAVIPALFIVIPSMRFGAVIYMALLASAIIMLAFIRRGNLGLAVTLPSGLIFSLFVLAVLSIARHGAIGFQEVLTQWADQILNEVQGIYQGFLSAEEMLNFQASRPDIQKRIVTFFPSVVLTSIAIVIWMNLLIVAAAFKNIALRDWRSPDWVIGVFIIAGILTITQHQAVRSIGLNLLIIVGQVYFFQGIAIVASYMSQNRWPGFLRWPLYIFILIQVYIMVIVAGIGLFDTWFDFRKRIRTSKGDEQ